MHIDKGCKSKTILQSFLSLLLFNNLEFAPIYKLNLTFEIKLTNLLVKNIFFKISINFPWLSSNIFHFCPLLFFVVVVATSLKKFYDNI